ncbi:MAG TPA: response regulator [Bacteroidia bacterium]|jgi:CheY-like chemotaxis protein|nr:response regulator [Bacteroidia bacterium]HQF27407.1 response regulator [Bacteroidia bacterium]HQK96780.1 response regulator [Bacteroidia bacterium]
MHNSKILIVDDRPENILTLESILDEPHRTFINATSGMEALLMTKIDQVDLILLDYNLDDMTGFDVAKELRKNESTKNIPIIFVTAMSKNERKKLNAFEIGTVDFIFKPLDMEEMQIKVAVFEKMAIMQRLLTEKAST